MTNEEPSVAETPQIQAGTLLKVKRKELGLTQEQVAERLCLKVSVVQNLENNDFSQQQVATFTRGYIRNYAKLVGVPEKEILSALDDCDSTAVKEQAMHSFSKKTNKEKQDSRIILISCAVVIAVVGISVLWWLGERELAEPELVQEPSTQIEELTEPVTVLGDEIQEPITLEPLPEIEQPIYNPEPETLPENEVSDDTALVEEQALIAETIEDVVVEEEVPVVDSDLPRLRLTLTGDCWLQVKDATGATLAIGTKSAGEVLDFDQPGSYSLVLGAPQNVSITFASEPVDLSGYTAGKVARITLP
ncbi:RodZ domain-containing protein [Vibrio sp. WXL103]|uniref:RodZ domain-containing protein n=1 Tax=Vibrio sp. WXL103 TaxID=3450710 RepID=UPI003EC791FC